MFSKRICCILRIPHPSLSAYENGKNSSTTETLINLAKKFHISLDQLCGISTTEHQLSSLSDIGDFLYQLLESNEVEVGVEIEVHNHLYDDVETETEKWYTRLTIFVMIKDSVIMVMQYYD